MNNIWVWISLGVVLIIVKAIYAWPGGDDDGAV